MFGRAEHRTELPLPRKVVSDSGSSHQPQKMAAFSGRWHSLRLRYDRPWLQGVPAARCWPGRI